MQALYQLSNGEFYTQNATFISKIQVNEYFTCTKMEQTHLCGAFVCESCIIMMHDYFL